MKNNKNTTMINWIKIRDKVPPEDKPVLFYSFFQKEYHVGYWSKYENGMLEFPPHSNKEGWKMDVEKWAFIE